MKKLLFMISVFCYIFSSMSFLNSETAVMYSPSRSRRTARKTDRSVIINTLKRVEVAPGDIVSQITLEFASPIFYKCKVTKAGEQVKLYFPGLRLSDFKGGRVVEQVRNLPDVRTVLLSEEVSDEVLIPSPTLTINFAKDSVILNLSKTTEENVFTLDIYNKLNIRVIMNQSTTIRTACNKKKKKLSPSKAHIVIDAGHGGEDSGASSFGLKEKSITLDIARRVFAFLKKAGYRVFLTRNTDSYLSVVDRFQLAQQLKADLFVSVHVNATNGSERVSGIETHFLDGRPFFGKNRNSRFLFVKNNSDRHLVSKIRKFLHEKISASHVLSKSIQNSLVGSLRKRNLDVVDRGVKQTGFRTLLRSEVPSSIVEVGFITNGEEAGRLAKSSYKNLVARGICRGIKGFFDSYSF